MARIRSIKPETWTDPEFVRCTPLARLLWIGSWNLADDQGVLKDEPERIRLSILPGDQVDAEALVEELVQARLLLRKRTTDGEAVLVIRTFREHQKIDARRDGRWGEADALIDPGTLDEALLTNGSRPLATIRAGPLLSATERDHTIKEGIKDQGGREASAAPKPAPTPTKKSTRIPIPFIVSDEMAEWAAREVPGFNWKKETPQFVDHFRAAPGAKGLKLDWPATWRKWMRSGAEGKYG